MTVQLTYTDKAAVAYPGMLSQPFSNPLQIDSRFVETAAVVAGQAAEAGSDAAKQIVGLASLANWSGVVFASQTVESQADGSLSYAPLGAASLVTKGKIFVVASEAVAVGDQVVPGTGAGSVKFGGGTSLGQCHAVALSASAADGDLLEIELFQQL
jgi:hypothetical protein